jgi:RsmE family RNA methyltransferase
MNICLFTSDEISIPLKKNDERAQHIVKVLHKNKGDSFDAGIIGGPAGTAVITEIDGEGQIFFDFTLQSRGKPLYPLTMIIGFPRPIQLRRLLRDMAGLGVRKIILAGTELTEKSYLESNVVSDGSAYKMLLDGTAQAAGTHVPELVVAKNLKEAISLAQNEADKAVSSISDAAGFNSGALNSSSKIALDNRRPTSSLHDFLMHEGSHSFIAAIGSERGWTDRERDLLEKSGFTLCSMGNRILRTETASTVAASLILDSMGVLN